ncbi:hypothetical protein [Arachnia propionica]|uniref:Uncharacterized protein n=1 Tax=Arachnia propionica TaxID=1750 RepID=A0A3P1WI40_9ACTN|nr:hypothetical protein [Arachnia propionica]RRD46314.1 hypothetical protein EII35_15580 [Arachnia propionica]
MTDPMHGIEEDVPFNHDHAYTLIYACFGAAETIRGQAGSRNLWKLHALKDFAGYYADLFERNGEIQASDASFLVTRLEEMATATGDLKAAARVCCESAVGVRTLWAG